MTSNELSEFWDVWVDLISDNLPVAAGLAAALILAIGLLVLVRRRRRTQLVVLPEADQGLVRRPRYLDEVVLSDTLAHLEANDHGSGLRGILEGDAETAEERETTRRTDQVRGLNKAIEAARRRADLATVIRSEHDELPPAGKVIEAYGRLRILPATRVADMLVRAESLLATPSAPAAETWRPVAEGSVLTRRKTDTDVPPPVFAAVETPQGRLFVLLEGDAMLQGLRDGQEVRVLGIVERLLERRDRIEPQDYLPQHLPTGVRGALRDRDLLDVAVPLAKAAGLDLRRKDLVERGPGAVITPAALW